MSDFTTFDFTSKSEIDNYLSNPGVFYFKPNTESETISKRKVQISKSDMNKIIENIQEIFRDIMVNLKCRTVKNEIIESFKQVIERPLFPGYQVVSLTSDLMNDFRLNHENYLICEKSDGIRYILIQFNNNKIVLVNRKYEFFLIETKITFPEYSKAHNQYKIENMLDGELVFDKIPENKKNDILKDPSNLGNYIKLNGDYYVYRFIIFDAILINGQSVGHLYFRTRLQILTNFMKQMQYNRLLRDAKDSFRLKYNIDFIGKNNVSFNRNTIKTVPIEIFMKDYFKLKDIGLIMNKISHLLPHENDGVIINKSDFYYYPGTSYEVMKWKPLKLNSIDFDITIENIPDKNKPLYVMKVFQKTPNDLITISCLFLKDSEEETFFLAELNNKLKLPNRIIAECYFDTEFDSDEIINFNLLYENKIIRKSDDPYSFYFKNYNSYYLKEFQKDKYFDKKKFRGGWRFLRFRNDKEYSNSYNTFLGVLKSIQQNITVEDIIDICNDKDIRKKDEININTESKEIPKEKKKVTTKKVIREKEQKDQKEQQDYQDYNKKEQAMNEEKNIFFLNTKRKTNFEVEEKKEKKEKNELTTTSTKTQNKSKTVNKTLTMNNTLDIINGKAPIIHQKKEQHIEQVIHTPVQQQNISFSQTSSSLYQPQIQNRITNNVNSFETPTNQLIRNDNSFEDMNKENPFSDNSDSEL